MTILIGLLTAVLVVSSLFLILLVLVQLPKKEAGIGMAFGGGAADALFGAGSGNALTKVTKYTAATFLGLSLLLSAMYAHRSGSGARGIDDAVKRASEAAAASAPATTPSPSGGAPAPTTPAGVTAPGTNSPAPIVPAPAPTPAPATNK